jgi:hypothetical protein
MRLSESVGRINGAKVLITGPSGFGKSTVASYLIERRPGTLVRLDEYAVRVGDLWLINTRKLWRKVLVKNHEFLVVEGTADNIVEVMEMLDVEELWIPLPPVNIYRKACRGKALAYMEDNNVTGDDPWVQYWMHESRNGDPVYRMHTFVEDTGFVGRCNIILTNKLKAGGRAWHEHQ